MKVVCCLKELGGEMKSVNENYFKRSPGNFQKSLTFGEIYVKYLEKISIVTGVLLQVRYIDIGIGYYSYIT